MDKESLEEFDVTDGKAREEKKSAIEKTRELEDFFRSDRNFIKTNNR